MNKKELSASLAGDVSLGGEISVHRLGFGAMRLTGEGIWGPPKDRKAALAVLRRAVELDVNFIDTADSYGPYVSEELIAEALFPYSAGLVVATKGGWNRPGPNQWTHDATPAHLRKAVEGSLKRLRLNRIDVYQLHIPDPVVSFEASVETLARLRNEGKIRLVALSNVTQEHIERARRIVPIVSVQNRYSFADREWDYVVDYCERNEIAFIPLVPIGGRQSSRRGAEPNRAGTRRESDANSAGLAPRAISRDVAYSRNFRNRTPRAERRLGFPASIRSRIRRALADSRAGGNARLSPCVFRHQWTDELWNSPFRSSALTTWVPST